MSTASGLRRACSILVVAALTAVALLGCSGSVGGYSGHYEADMGGGKVMLDFSGGNKVNVTLASPDGKDSIMHHCVYVVSDGKMVITTDEPMGVPMTLAVAGDKLDDNGTIFSKK
jgi:hypothetical protein